MKIQNIFQVCYIHMILKEFDAATTALTPDNLVMMSAIELTQYYITDWELKYFDQGFIFSEKFLQK